MKVDLRAIGTRRFRRRLMLVTANVANGLLIPLLNPLVALLVVRLASIELWGEYVTVLIGVQLAAHIIGWGNKEYLLREFSFNPARSGSLWRSSLFTRSLLLLPYGLIVWSIEPARAGWLLIWCAVLVFDQSFEVWVTYKKDFVFAVGVELIGLLVTLAGISWLGARVDVSNLVVISILATTVKAVIYQMRYRSSTWARLPDRSIPPIELAYFRRAFAFFALGFTGLLQSRIDLYLVSLFLPKSLVGQYQVFMNLLLYLQSLSNFVLGPFVKNLYRLSYRSILNLSRRLLALGALLCLPGLLLIDVMLRIYYGFDLPPIFFVAGGAAALPIYFYLPIIYALYKGSLAGRVVWINVLGISASAAISLLLLPTLGLLGAVLGAAAAQLVMLLVYVWQSRELREDHALTVPELS